MNHKKGFTLIELLIVMIILGVLAAIGVNGFLASQKKGRDTLRKESLKAMSQALEMYYNDKKQYPLGDGAGSMIGCGTGPAVCTAHTVWKDANTIYMAQFPADPSAAQRYYYVSADGKQYQIYAYLENNQDIQIMTPSVGSTNCGSGIACNYGVSSTNVQP